MRSEIYVSTDVEADGPIPGPNSMLSFASAALSGDGQLLGTFSANLETLPGATADPRTSEWWATQPEAWAACRSDPQPAEEVMPRYVRWLRALPGKPVFVGYPASYDFLFVYWYLQRFAGESPFGVSALDAKSYAMALLGVPFADAVKARMPLHWFDDRPHTHVALDDALEQGVMFCNMLAQRRRSAHEELERIVRADVALMQLLRTAREAALPQWRVVAGGLYQTVWNVLTARAPGTGINDYDLIYFDGSDLSAEAESEVERRIRARLPDLPAPVEVCNQARVHLWFESQFGIAYPPLASADESLLRYASTTHAVGVRLEADDRLDIHAPFGLQDVFDFVIRPNYALPNRATHERKAARAQALWPQVRVIPWDPAESLA
ncbi:MAG: nucleotidyltransferase family protein [Steroidobacteraceae bacterium]